MFKKIDIFFSFHTTLNKKSKISLKGQCHEIILLSNFIHFNSFTIQCLGQCLQYTVIHLSKTTIAALVLRHSEFRLLADRFCTNKTFCVCTQMRRDDTSIIFTKKKIEDFFLYVFAISQESKNTERLKIRPRQPCATS
jgi:hypothetical protein